MLKYSTIEKLRNSQSAAQDIWNDLMAAIKSEESGDVVATSEDLGLLTMAAVKLNQAQRIIESLRYRHDSDYKRKG